MARCEDCLHYQVCLDTEARHLRIILAGDTAERCKRFMLSADVVPKSEVEWLYKQVDCLSQEVMYNDDIAKMKVDEAKSEVAREIFEAINEDCFDQFGYFEYEAYAELKKKYTEEKK